MAAKAEVRDFRPEEFLRPRRVRSVAADAPLALHGAVQERVGGGLVVALAADLVDAVTKGPSLGRVPVAAAAVSLGKRFVFQGIEQGGATRRMRIVTLSAHSSGQRVSLVSRAQVRALQIVTAGAEPVLTVQQDELVVRAVIEVTGAAVSPADGEVNVGTGKRLDVILVAGATPAVDAPLKRRGFGKGSSLRESGGGGRGRRRGRRGRRGRRAGLFAAPQIGFCPVAADAARATAGDIPEFEYQAGGSTAVEGGPDEPGIGR